MNRIMGKISSNHLLFLFFFLMVYSLTGQSLKQKPKSVCLLTFQAPDAKYFKETELLGEFFSEIISNRTKREVFNKNNVQLLNKFREDEIQKNLSFINGYVTETGISAGSEYIIGGKIESINYLKNTFEEVNCDLQLSVNIIDTKTGELMARKTFGSKYFEFNKKGDSNIQAFNETLKSYQNRISKYISNYLPITFDIVDIGLVNHKPEILLFNDFDFEVKRGQKLGIYQIINDSRGNQFKARKKLLKNFRINRIEGKWISGDLGKKSFDILELYQDQNVLLKVEIIDEGQDIFFVSEERKIEIIKEDCLRIISLAKKYNSGGDYKSTMELLCKKPRIVIREYFGQILSILYEANSNFLSKNCSTTIERAKKAFEAKERAFAEDLLLRINRDWAKCYTNSRKILNEFILYDSKEDENNYMKEFINNFEHNSTSISLQRQALNLLYIEKKIALDNLNH